MRYHLFTAGLAALAATGALLLAQPPTEVPQLPICRFEDGSDIDGQCLWIDPDTGNAYINPTPEEVSR